MIAIHEDANNAAKDEAFAQYGTSKFERRDVPFCPVHDTTMRAYMTRGRITYYACRCKTCDVRSKVIATVVIVMPRNGSA